MVIFTGCVGEVLTPGEVPPLSCTARSKVTVPLASAAGVYARWHSLPDTVTLGPADRMLPGSLMLVTMQSARVWPDSLPGPGLKLSPTTTPDCAPASSFTAGASWAVKLGASLTQVTLTSTDAVEPPGDRV